MRGMGHSDPIETVYVTHEEGNEREKNGVKRGIAGFYGAKLLKKQGDERERRSIGVGGEDDYRWTVMEGLPSLLAHT